LKFFNIACYGKITEFQILDALFTVIKLLFINYVQTGRFIFVVVEEYRCKDLRTEGKYSESARKDCRNFGLASP
jgi:hypothetical protein